MKRQFLVARSNSLYFIEEYQDLRRQVRLRKEPRTPAGYPTLELLLPRQE